MEGTTRILRLCDGDVVARMIANSDGSALPAPAPAPALLAMLLATSSFTWPVF